MSFLHVRAFGVLAAWLAVGCAPALNWREVRPEGSGVVVLLPCKPSSYARNVKLAGGEVQLSLQVCSSDGLTWALAFADLADPARVPGALAALRQAAMANLGAATAAELPVVVAGAPASPAPLRFEISGQMPDGTRVLEQVALFSQGTRVFQATVLGPHLPAQEMDTFFGGLRLVP